MNILSQLTKARFALKRKFDDLKQFNNHTNLQLEVTFKLIIEPLHELVKENKKQKISNVKVSIKVKREMKQIKKYDNDERKLDDFYFTTNEKDLQSNRNITPPRSFDDSDSYNQFFSQTNIEEDIEHEKKETEKNEEEGTTPLPMYTGEADMGVDAELEDNNAGYNYDLNISNSNSKGYGPKKSANNSLILGDKELKIKDNKITFSSGTSCDLTPGLCSLIFLSKPENYDDQDLEMYKQIILKTNIHRVGCKPNNRIKGTRAYKYNHFIKKLIDKDFSPTTSTPLRSKTGFGYMTLKKSNPNYVYWNDVNELVERLEIFVASKGVGITSHNNEIF